MRKYLEEHVKEVLLILVTVLGIIRWWIPDVRGFEKLYAASHWILSYDYGLIRRGLVGTMMELWLPIVSIGDIHLTALVAYCTLIVFLLITFYFLLRYKDESGRLFNLILFFLACPATISLIAHNLGRFDLFLIIITFLSLALLSLRRLVWLIPILMITAMFIHEGFLILFAPTILAAILFIYLRNTKEKGMLATLIVSAVSVVGVFIVLYKFGTPTLGYEEFSHAIQSRATFWITGMSMQECYFGIRDHYRLASSSLYDVGSIADLFVTILILSPVFLILLNLWMHALRNCGGQKIACRLFLIATLSGFVLVPVTIDYGRWLSAVVFCNFFVIFFFVSRGVIKVRELTEYESGTFKLMLASVIFMYLIFGPLNEFSPYPYKSNVIFNSFSIIVALFFDVGFYIRWHALSIIKKSR